MQKLKQGHTLHQNKNVSFDYTKAQKQIEILQKFQGSEFAKNSIETFSVECII